MGGDIAVVAHGVNDGSGRVNAEAEFSFADIRTLNLHDVTIDVAALNRGNGTGGAKRSAVQRELEHRPFAAQPQSSGGRE